ncbi:unnamed protein product [Mortierella alpina]
MDDDDNASVVFSWSDNDDELRDEITALEQSVDTPTSPKAVPEIVNEVPNRWRTPEPPRQRSRKWDLQTPAPKNSGASRTVSSNNIEPSDVVRRGDLRAAIEQLAGPTKPKDLRAHIKTLESTPSVGRDLREEIQVMTKTFGDQVLGEPPSPATPQGDRQVSMTPLASKLVAVRRDSDTYRPSSRRRSYSRRDSRSRSRSRSRERYRSRSRGRYTSRSRRRTRSRSRGWDRDWDRGWDRGRRRSRSRSRSRIRAGVGPRSRSRSRSRGRRSDRNRRRSTSRSRAWTKETSRGSSSSQSKSSATAVSASITATTTAIAQPSPLSASAVSVAPATGGAEAAGTSAPNTGAASVGAQGLVSRPALPTPPSAFGAGVVAGISDATAPSRFSSFHPATPPSTLPSSSISTSSATTTPLPTAPATSTPSYRTAPPDVSTYTSVPSYSSSATSEEQQARALAGSPKQACVQQMGPGAVAPDSAEASSARTLLSSASEHQQGQDSASMVTEQSIENEGIAEAPPPSAGSNADDSDHPARYFLMRCGRESEIEDARTTNTWPTNPVYDKSLRQAYDPSTPVYLIFTVRLAREFYGIAKMASAIGWLEERSIFDRSKFRQKMQLQWISYARVSYESITEKLHKPGYAVITRNGQELGKDIGSFIHEFLESQRDQPSVFENVASNASMDIDQEQVSDESHMQVEPDPLEVPQAATRVQTKEDYLAEVQEEDLREARQGQALAQAQALARAARAELLDKTLERPKEQAHVPAYEDSGSDMDIDSGDEGAVDEKERASRASDGSSMDLDTPGEAAVIMPQEQPSLDLSTTQDVTLAPSKSARRELVGEGTLSREESAHKNETWTPEEVTVRKDPADEAARGRPKIRFPLPPWRDPRAGPSHPSPSLHSPTLQSPTSPSPRIVSGQRPPILPPPPRIKDDRSFASSARFPERSGPRSRHPSSSSGAGASVRYHSPPPPVSKPRYRSPPPRRNPTPPPPRSRNRTPPPPRPRSFHDRPSTWTDYSYSRPPLSPPLPPLQYEIPGTSRYSPARRRTPIRAPADPRLARAQSAGSNSSRMVDSGPNSRQATPSVIPEKRPYPREPLPVSMPAVSDGVDPYASLGHDGSSDEGGGGAFSPPPQSQGGDGEGSTSQPVAKITLVPAGLSKTQRKKQRKLALQKSARLPSPSLP